MRVVTPAPRDAWREVLESDPTAFVYQTPEGIDAICAGTNLRDASRLYEFDHGRRLILPLYGRRGVPRPLAVERSPLVGSLISSGAVRVEELRAIFTDLTARLVFRVSVVPTAITGDAWDLAVPDTASRLPKVAHVLELTNDFQTIWEDRFNSQARRGVRKAEKARLEVECGRGDALLPEFYQLFRLSVDRWAKQRHEPRFLARWRAQRRVPFEKLRRRMATLGDACRIWVARLGGDPAAAIVVLQGANAHYTMGAMDKDLAGPTRANFLLHKVAIEDACSAGCRYYNMGETGTSATLARFKSHFGANAYSYHEYRFERLPVTALERRLRGWVRRISRRVRNTSSSPS